MKSLLIIFSILPITCALAATNSVPVARERKATHAPAKIVLQSRDKKDAKAEWEVDREYRLMFAINRKKSGQPKKEKK